MTPSEDAVLEHLRQAWNLFVTLPVQHSDDTAEFRRSLHDLQRIIGMRQVRRCEPDAWTNIESDVPCIH